jgi:ubiquinol-cytochrome c reductase iron-sulfur subunit
MNNGGATGEHEIRSDGARAGSTTTQRTVALAFIISMVASVSLVAVYVAGGNRPAEGILLGLALGGLGVGVVAWTVLIDVPVQTEERPSFEESPEEEGETAPTGDRLSRRAALVRLGLGAAATFGAALAIPTLSLGPTPGQSLYRTRWTDGARVVNSTNQPIRPEDLPLEGVMTVFPEDNVGSADSQTLLVRVDPALLQLPHDRSDWAPEGCVGYSKVCTHAGCPVGLYRAEAHQFLCPCHQSTFDVLRGATPVFGPAVRPLPQLPLEVDDDGYLVARGDFSQPVGPSFWNVTS